MGKVKPSGKHRARVAATASPQGISSSGSRREGPGGSVVLSRTAEAEEQAVMLVQDMGSVSDEKRYRACLLFGSIFAQNTDSAVPAERLLEAHLLQTLRTRLSDSSSHVRLAAAGALRNMAACKDETVVRRIEALGLGVAIVEYATQALVSVSSTNQEFSENILAAVCNLCTSSDVTVQAATSDSFIQTLMALVSNPPTPRILASALHVLLVVTESNPAACCKACMYTTSSDPAAVSQARFGMSILGDIVEGASDIYRLASPTNLSVLIPNGSDLQLPNNIRGYITDLKLARLYSAGVLVHTLSCNPEHIENVADASTLRDVMQRIETSHITRGSGHVVPLVQGVLETLSELASVSDQVVSECILPDVTQQFGTAAVVEQAAELDLSSAATGSRAPTSNSRPEGSEEVLIGAASEGDERPCQRDMDVAKTALELLANFCVLTRDRSGGASHLVSRASLGSTGSAGGADWTALDEDEGERLMDAMAAAQSSDAGSKTSYPHPSVSPHPAPTSAYAALMLSISAASKCASVLAALLGLVQQFKAMASAPVSADRQPYSVPSTIINTLEVMEASIVCLTNMADYDVTVNLDEVSIPMASLLSNALSASLDVLFAVTPFAGSSPSASEATPQKGNSIQREWTLSQCVQAKDVERSSRVTALAALRSLIALYQTTSEAQQQRALSAPDAAVSSLLFANRRNMEIGMTQVVPGLIDTVVRCVFVPILELNTAACVLISTLASAFNGDALSKRENAALSVALMRRAAEPRTISLLSKTASSGTNSAGAEVDIPFDAIIIRSARSDGGSTVASSHDATLGVMTACLSTVIDLHSSDHLEYLETYRGENIHKELNNLLSAFNHKLQIEGKLLDREALSTCKETALNLKRFIKYKASFLK